MTVLIVPTGDFDTVALNANVIEKLFECADREIARRNVGCDQ